MIDHEMRHADALLADLNQPNRPRLAARSVAGVEDPERLVRHVRTDGWTPVDARLKVGNVAQLVRRLGGEELYGRDPTVPLRELIQNGSDAVRARRALENRAETWGSVTVRLGEDTQGYWLEVEDTGVGMSADVLTGTLLDFGASYWGSSLMRQELPGVLARGFEATGQYGIGFFSVFMWGQRVRVITRRPEVAQRDTLVLEFETGLQSRPILRSAAEEEVIREGGTRVRVWLRDSPYEARGLLYRSSDNSLWRLSALCAWLAPALDVDLFAVQEAQGRELVIIANDWMTAEPRVLLERIQGPHSASAEDGYGDIGPTDTDQYLRLIQDVDGTTTGRAALTYEHLPRRPSRSGRGRIKYRRARHLGIVTVGGLRSTEIRSVGGVLVGKPVRAARDVAIPVVSSNALAQWASGQGRLLHGSVSSVEAQVEVAALIRALGGDTDGFPVAETALGWLTASEIASQEQPDEVFLVHDAAASLARGAFSAEKFALKPEVFAVSKGKPAFLQTQGTPYVDWPPTRGSNGRRARFHGSTLSGLVIEALARAWGSTVKDVLRVSALSDDYFETEREIAVADGEPVIERVDVIRNPAKYS